MQLPKAGLFHALGGGAHAATNATLVGDITLGQGVGVWFGCVLRGDDAPLVIGERTNVQDLTMIHADTGVPNIIGSETTIGHRCVLHGARVGTCEFALAHRNVGLYIHSCSLVRSMYIHMLRCA